MKKKFIAICIIITLMMSLFLVSCNKEKINSNNEDVTKLMIEFLKEKYDYTTIYPLGAEIKEPKDNDVKFEDIKVNSLSNSEETVYIYQVEAKIYHNGKWDEQNFAFYITKEDSTLMIKEGFKNDTGKSNYTATLEKEEHTTDQDIIKHISDYLKEEYNYHKIYSMEEEVKDPIEDDLQLMQLEKSQELSYDNEVYGIFKIKYKVYFDKNWHDDFSVVVLSKPDSDTKWKEFVKEIYRDEKKQKNYVFTKKDILEIKYDLRDLHASFKFNNDSNLIGIGSDAKVLELEEIKERETHTFNIYEEGDYWVTYFYPDMTAACYYNKKKDQASILSVESNRKDIITYDGVKIGDTYETVDKVYSNLEGFYLIEKNENHILYAQMEVGLGINLDFEFTNGILSNIKFFDFFD